jgi:hypothetical protein
MDTPSDTEVLLFGALGEAVVKFWSNLPQAVQQHLFEQAVTCRGERVRQPLALYLHDKHSRTVDAIKAHAMPEPDSLGG